MINDNNTIMIEETGFILLVIYILKLYHTFTLTGTEIPVSNQPVTFKYYITSGSTLYNTSQNLTPRNKNAANV